MCILIRIKSGVNSGQQALEKIQFEGTIAQKLEAIMPRTRIPRWTTTRDVGTMPNHAALSFVPLPFGWAQLPVFQAAFSTDSLITF